MKTANNDKMDIAGIRKDYTKFELTEDLAPGQPLPLFNTWFNDAVEAELPDANAMILSTLKEDGTPDARVVLLKNISNDGFTFFTNYESNKGRQLAKHPAAALTFFWPGLERQVRVSGMVSKVSPEESDEYYRHRPKGSRIGALLSPQSSVIPDRQYLENLQLSYNQQYAHTEDIPRPAHWGGYRLIPQAIEFWQGRASRLHDRLLYTRLANGAWTKVRLAP